MCCHKYLFCLEPYGQYIVGKALNFLPSLIYIQDSNHTTMHAYSGNIISNIANLLLEGYYCSFSIPSNNN